MQVQGNKPSLFYEKKSIALKNLSLMQSKQTGSKQMLSLNFKNQQHITLLTSSVYSMDFQLLQKVFADSIPLKMLNNLFYSLVYSLY